MANPSVGASHCAQASRDVLRAADQWPGQHHQHSRSSASSWFTSLITFNLQEYDLQLCSIVYTDMLCAKTMAATRPHTHTTPVQSRRRVSVEV